MTSQRLVEEFAAWLRARDAGWNPNEKRPNDRIPDSYLNEAAVFLAGELGQRLQRAQLAEVWEEGRGAGYRQCAAEEGQATWGFGSSATVPRPANPYEVAS